MCQTLQTLYHTDSTAWSGKTALKCLGFSAQSHHPDHLCISAAGWKGTVSNLVDKFGRTLALEKSRLETGGEPADGEASSAAAIANGPTSGPHAPTTLTTEALEGLPIDIFSSRITAMRGGAGAGSITGAAGSLTAAQHDRNKIRLQFNKVGGSSSVDKFRAQIK